jgi:anti-sigma-K factor RskA
LIVEDIKAYIESGILELYVLGDVSHEEKLGVEAMAAKHPAIKAELAEIEKSLELYAKANEVEPADNLRERILNSLVVNLGDDRTFDSKRGERPDAKVVSLERPNTGAFFKYAFAACLALLIASVIALVSVYNRLQVSNNLVASLQGQNQKFANTVSFKDTEIAVLRDPSYKLLKMTGTPKSPASGLTVAWSPEKKKVWIDMADAKMPANDTAHQYQLWALVGGKPVSLGVFDADTTSKDMKEMQSIASADAFAVTLEKRGGSPAPTMDEMVVIGKF